MSVVRSLYRTILPPRLRAGLRHWRGVARRVAAGPIPGRPEAHMAQLDGLRALAVLAVIVQHTFPADAETKIGRPGVRLFYVLSGFLITGILLRTRARCASGGGVRHVMRSFYARRFLRIFPLYYFVLGATLLLGLPDVRAHVWAAVTYTLNIQSAAEGTFFPTVGHFWSLAVEEQFYLFWPVLMLLVPSRYLLAAVLAAIAVAPASRLLLFRYAGGGAAWEAATTSCLDTLGGGALLALLVSSDALSARARKGLEYASLGAGLALFALIKLWLTRKFHALAVALEDTAYLLIFSAVVSGAARGFGGWGKRVLEFRPLVYLGTISYGIYVYHNFVPAVASLLRERYGIETGFPADQGAARFVCVSLATVAIAACSWHLFEEPINRLKKHFPYLTEKKIVGEAPRRGAIGGGVAGLLPVSPWGASGLRARPDGEQADSTPSAAAEVTAG
jgi:peptidoglycan/LPS O-acetylase OafA/YrhL